MMLDFVDFEHYVILSMMLDYAGFECWILLILSMMLDNADLSIILNFADFEHDAG